MLTDKQHDVISKLHVKDCQGCAWTGAPEQAARNSSNAAQPALARRALRAPTSPCCSVQLRRVRCVAWQLVQSVPAHLSPDQTGIKYVQQGLNSSSSHHHIRCSLSVMQLQAVMCMQIAFRLLSTHSTALYCEEGLHRIKQPMKAQTCHTHLQCLQTAVLHGCHCW